MIMLLVLLACWTLKRYRADTVSNDKVDDMEIQRISRDVTELWRYADNLLPNVPNDVKSEDWIYDNRASLEQVVDMILCASTNSV